MISSIFIQKYCSLKLVDLSVLTVVKDFYVSLEFCGEIFIGLFGSIMAVIIAIMGRENLEIKSVMKHHALFIQTFAMFGVVVNI